MISNLLSNAFNYGKKKVDVVLRVTETHFTITVSNDGPVIPPEMKEKIFRPNFTTKSSGMGMALAIVYSIIVNIEGKIWFNSALNKGTTFYVSLPLIKADEAKA